MLEGIKKWSGIKQCIFIVLLLILVVAIFTPRSNTNHFLSAGIGMHGHVGNLRGNFNLETFSGNGDAVLFYAPWCGHCKRVMPHWDNLEKSNVGVNVKKVNSDENKELTEKHGITGFPTIRYFSNGMDDHKNYETFTGPRDTKSLVNWLNNVSKANNTGGPNGGKSASF